LDLYQGVWDGLLLGSDDFVISADEKTSIQARHRRHETLPARAQEGQKVEFEYRRQGALNYLAAWDVRRAKLFGRCEPKTGIIPFNRLVEDVMTCEPYCSAKRVFWILDNGSSHRGLPSINRLQGKWPQIIVVHLPVHASWLNQIEIYFSILQRKVLTPNDFLSLVDLRERIGAFQERYEKIARPFSPERTCPICCINSQTRPWRSLVPHNTSPNFRGRVLRLICSGIHGDQNQLPQSVNQRMLRRRKHQSRTGRS